MSNSLCIGFLEYISIGRGLEAADLISKNADIKLLLAAPNCPGRYQILFTGDVGAVNEAVALAEEHAGFNFLDSLVLPRVDNRVVQAFYGADTGEIGDSIGVLETMTMTATLEGADTMVKTSDVRIVELRLGKGLAGKSYVIVTGTVQDVQAAVDASLETVRERGVIISSVVIPSLNRDLVRHLTG